VCHAKNSYRGILKHVRHAKHSYRGIPNQTLKRNREPEARGCQGTMIDVSKHTSPAHVPRQKFLPRDSPTHVPRKKCLQRNSQTHLPRQKFLPRDFNQTHKRNRWPEARGCQGIMIDVSRHLWGKNCFVTPMASILQSPPPLMAALPPRRTKLLCLKHIMLLVNEVVRLVCRL